MVLNIEAVINANPIENILINLIESGTFNVLFVGEFERRYDFKILLEAMRMYMLSKNSDICVRLDKRYENDTFINTLIDAYGMKNNIEYAKLEDDDILLSYYLGCDVIIGSDNMDDELKLANKFFVPFILLKDGDMKINKGLIEIPNGSEELCSALILVREDKNHEVLTGHKMIIEESK